MKYLFLASLLVVITGCDLSSGSDPGRHVLFEASNGNIYRLDTTDGASEVFYSPNGRPKLTVNGYYNGEDGSTYEYQGNGVLTKLSEEEVLDLLMRKYGE